MRDVEPSPRFGRLSPGAVIFRLTVIVALSIGVPLAAAWWLFSRMPGTSAPRSLPPLDGDESATQARLLGTLTGISNLGEHNLDHPEALAAVARLIENDLTRDGLSVTREPVEVRAVVSSNLEARVDGRQSPNEILVIGAHYDSARGATGANDNGSGVAALLELAARFAHKPARRGLRFVAFTNEEPPYFRKDAQMGSRVYADSVLHQPGTRVVGMISLETMGYFSDAPRSQRYPFPFSLYYPERGDFIAFVSNYDSRDFVRRSLGLFRERATIPSEGGALPARLPGVGWSDHESFYRAGVPALMVTDTAPFRYPHYHTREDTVDKLDVARLSRVVVGLAHVIDALANE